MLKFHFLTVLAAFGLMAAPAWSAQNSVIDVKGKIQVEGPEAYTFSGRLVASPRIGLGAAYVTATGQPFALVTKKGTVSRAAYAWFYPNGSFRIVLEGNPKLELEGQSSNASTIAGRAVAAYHNLSYCGVHGCQYRDYSHVGNFQLSMRAR